MRALTTYESSFLDRGVSRLSARGRGRRLVAIGVSCLALTLPSLATAAQPGHGRPGKAAVVKPLRRLKGATARKKRNLIFILSDDHRYDAMGFLGHPWLKTPHMDGMAKNGVHMKNAFVTTSLCSPSRASILTGLYAHRHGVVDNQHPVRADLVFFPRYLQKAGYETGFFGKWHMGGHSDDPQPGFDQWVSFPGQGNYYPAPEGLNVNGERVPQKGYISDELTDYALDWLNNRKSNKPFFMYLSHKGVHADFEPAKRHAGTYEGKKMPVPETMALTKENLEGRPRWVRDQRNSWHGVDYPYHSDLDIEAYYRRYAETLLGVDESIGRVVDHLKEKGLYDSTLVIYMGDNGFAFGEHGLIDKRTAYEESMRVPMLVQCPELFPGGQTAEQVVANIDVGPTFLEAAGLQPPRYVDGKSFLPIAQGQSPRWRDHLLYEYYWERNFPQTPTIHAVRGDRYKYVHVHGVWDIDELYDLREDPLETHNLIASPGHQTVVERMKTQLFGILEETDGLHIPLQPDSGNQHAQRRRTGPLHAPFPKILVDPR